ncbi:MAG: hypothetical protein ACO1RX_06855 [Candidatus Sericytochromatia bacterium]
MLTREAMHRLIDELPQRDLEVLSRVLEGLQATQPVHAHAAVAQHSVNAPPTVPSHPPLLTASHNLSPLVPPPAMRPPERAGLASQYSHLMRQEESPENQSLLRRVMFTPLSDLLAWVNQPAESSVKRP